MTAGLIYHDVVFADAREQTGFPGPLAARYKLTPEQFERHLDALVTAGADVGLVSADGRRPGVALTFDDGGASATAAAQALETRGWRGHFFITTGRIGTPGFLDADDVRDLAARGHVVGSHSHTHPTYMGHLTADELAREWTQSRDELTEILGAPPDVAAVPGGFLSPEVIATAAQAGYRVLMTSQPTRRVERHGTMEILGRYSIWASTPPTTATGYALGRLWPCARLWGEWQAKTLAKRINPDMYQRLRYVRAR